MSECISNLRPIEGTWYDPELGSNKSQGLFHCWEQLIDVDEGFIQAVVELETGQIVKMHKGIKFLDRNKGGVK